MLHIRAQNQLWYAGISVLVFLEKDNKAFVAEPLTYRESKDTENRIPTLELTRSEAQSLIDDLWHCGLRPSEKIGSVGQLKATERHLEDMRTLVFKEINT